MEVYFKNLISEDGSLDKLVDDLSVVVQGADHFASAIAPSLPEVSRAELNSRVARLKGNYERIKQQASAGVRATDKAVRNNPYWSIGAALIVGLIAGWKFAGRK